MSNNNWKEDFKKFQSPHSKILYMIFYYHKNEELNEEERTKLKEYVILEEEKIFEIVTEFESTLDEMKLLSDMKRLYSEEVKFLTNTNNNNQDEEGEIYQKNSNERTAGFKKPLSVNTSKSFLKNAMSTINKRENTNSNDSSNKQVKIEELNSPVGNSLMNKKRQQQNQRKSNTPAEKSDKPTKAGVKGDMYMKSFLGRAVGSLGEDEK